jgi:hypothetical protein
VEYAPRQYNLDTHAIASFNRAQLINDDRDLRGTMAPAVSKLTLVLLVACMGCGPITAASKISDARSELKKAEDAQAPKFAPFEYQGALLYLEKAREEEGYACYQDAVDLAAKSFALSTDAQHQAAIRRAEIAEEARKAESSEGNTDAEPAK